MFLKEGRLLEHHTVKAHYVCMARNSCIRYVKTRGVLRLLPFAVLHQGKRHRNIKSWDQQIYLVIRGFCYNPTSL